ncbi:MAG: carbon-nitrogen hydrolase [Puniceicoccales bacterium]|jgi:N-carbamoylputrescine amidase|nr:carbon-nitrogen hydrolase [Puniceicoccales bacterium]
MTHDSHDNTCGDGVAVGLIQLAAAETPAANLRKTIPRIEEAAAKGAQIIGLQEMFTTRYFCASQNPAHFDLAEPIPSGPSTCELQAVARRLGVVIVAPMFEARGSEVYHNTAAILDADGTCLGKYRKMHIPQDPAFEEKFYFTPGDLGFRTWQTAHGKVGVLICWDQWYPEAARLTALAGADILFYPTAIGWLSSEKAALGAAQHCAWETVQRGHAVANGCHVAVANRVGTEGDTEFWGQSFVANPYGQIIAKASADKEEILIARCDLAMQRDFRRIWPFFRDRRIDAYGDISRRLVEPHGA